MPRVTERTTLTELDRRSSPRLGAGARRSLQIALPQLDDAAPAPTGEMDEGVFDPHRSYLLPRFRAFHAELMRLRNIAVRDPHALLDGGAPIDLAKIDINEICRAITRHLQLMLDRFEHEASVERGAEGAKLLRDSQYVMAALADEVFLNTDWAGREEWLGSMLEQAMFGTQVAGEDVFRRLDQVLSARTNGSLELASVYFLSLALGFEGRFRGGSGEELARYRRRLYRFLYRTDTPPSDGKLVPQAYQHTAAAERAIRLPYVQRWTILLAVTAIAYFVAAEFVWRSITSDLSRTAIEIVRMAAGTRR
jgi:type VI secretion system protein ImpK